MELIDYAEQQGLANFAWHTQVNEITRQEANTTLGFLLAGGGAALALSVSQAVGPGTNWPLTAAVIVLSCWLFALAACVVFRCLCFIESLPPANQPLRVYQPDFNLPSIRKIQLEYLENAILNAIEKNKTRAKRLVLIRQLTCLSPVVFLLAWALFRATLH